MDFEERPAIQAYIASAIPALAAILLVLFPAGRANPAIPVALISVLILISILGVLWHLKVRLVINDDAIEWTVPFRKRRIPWDEVEGIWLIGRGGMVIQSSSHRDFTIPIWCLRSTAAVIREIHRRQPVFYAPWPGSDRGRLLAGLVCFLAGIIVSASSYSLFPFLMFLGGISAGVLACIVFLLCLALPLDFSVKWLYVLIIPVMLPVAICKPISAALISRFVTSPEAHTSWGLFMVSDLPYLLGTLSGVLFLTHLLRIRCGKPPIVPDDPYPLINPDLQPLPGEVPGTAISDKSPDAQSDTQPDGGR